MPASLWKSLIGRQETHAAEDLRPDPGFLRDHSLLSFYKVELRNDGVIIAADMKTRVWEDKFDGMLLLETTDLKSNTEDVVRRHKELTEIEYLVLGC